MRKLHNRWKEATIVLSLASIIIFGTLSMRYLYLTYKDIPHAPCYATTNFIHITDKNEYWTGYGDTMINKTDGEFYFYYTITSPSGKKYIYDRKFDINIKNIDSSRFSFYTKKITTYEDDSAKNEIAFMGRGVQGGLITFTYFSDTEYYFNINNLVVGVCHVPS